MPAPAVTGPLPPPAGTLYDAGVTYDTKSHSAQNAAAGQSRERFITAAGEIFLRHGYSRSTIRLITAEAGTSLAQLNRHWTGKQQLFEEVFARHFDPIHRAQAAALDEVEASGRGADLRAILNAFLAPAMITASTDRNSHLIYSKALMDPAEEAKAIVRDLVMTIYPRMVSMLKAALPDAPPRTFFFVITTVMGAYVHSQVRGPQTAEAVGLDYDEIDWNQAGGIITDLLVKGLEKGSRA